MFKQLNEVFHSSNWEKIINRYQEAYNSSLLDPRNTFTCLRGCIESLVEMLARSKNINFKPATILNEKLNILKEYQFDSKIIEQLRTIKNLCNNAAHLKDDEFIPDTANAILKLNEFHILLIAVAKKYFGLSEDIVFKKPDNNEWTRSQIYREALENHDAGSLYLTGIYMEELNRKINKAPDSADDTGAQKGQYTEHAKYFYTQAGLHCNSGYDHKALYRLALICLKQSKTVYISDIPDDLEIMGTTYLEQSSERGNPEAQNLYAEIHLNRHSIFDNGNQVIIQKAMKYLENSAEQDNFQALHNIMHFYTTGLFSDDGNIFIAIDHNKAFDYGWRAANAGYASAQFKLSLMLRDGIGCNKDIVKADKWFRMALAKHDKRAIVYHINNNATDISNTAMRNYLAILEDNQSPSCNYILAREYFYANILKQDLLKSLIMLLEILKHRDSYQVTATTDYENLTTDHFLTEEFSMPECEILIKKVAKMFINKSSVEAQPVYLRMFRHDGYPHNLTIDDFEAAVAKAKKENENFILSMAKSDFKSQIKEQNISRNDPCPCKSGKKYKNCHLNIDLE